MPPEAGFGPLAIFDPGTEVLQNAAAALANGAALDVQGWPRFTLNVTGAFVATVAFEGTLDGATWFAIGLKPVADTAAVTTTTAPGAFKAPGDLALAQVRARVSAYTSGSVTVVARKAR